MAEQDLFLSTPGEDVPGKITGVELAWPSDGTRILRLKLLFDDGYGVWGGHVDLPIVDVPMPEGVEVLNEQAALERHSAYQP